MTPGVLRKIGKAKKGSWWVTDFRVWGEIAQLKTGEKEELRSVPGLRPPPWVPCHSQPLLLVQDWSYLPGLAESVGLSKWARLGEEVIRQI
jgi:hypothetical protein